MKRLSLIVKTMGGNLSYAFKDNIHEYAVAFGLFEKKYRSNNESSALKEAEEYVKKTYPILYRNALNHLKF
jgi:hypothetical protein